MEQYGYYTLGLKQAHILEVDKNLSKYVHNINTNKFRIVTCDMDKERMEIARMKKCGKKKNVTHIIEVNEVMTIDIGNEGIRWEGGNVNGEPCGYGCIYDEDNKLIFCGFMYNRKIIGHGKQFYRDTNSLEYCGTFMNGMRHGWGSLYDKEGNLIYEGKWALGRNDCFSLRANSIHDDGLIHNLLNEITIGNRCFICVKEFTITRYGSLKSIEIGNHSFKAVELFDISNCPELETLKIGQNSFNKATDYTSEKKENSSFSIHECSKLLKIKIGTSSFGDFSNRVKLISINVCYLYYRSSFIE